MSQSSSLHSGGLRTAVRELFRFPDPVNEVSASLVAAGVEMAYLGPGLRLCSQGPDGSKP